MINNLRILVGTMYGLVAFERLRDNILFLTSISSVGLRKTELLLIGERKSSKLFFEVSNRRLNVSGNVYKIFVKNIGYILRFS